MLEIFLWRKGVKGMSDFNDLTDSEMAMESYNLDPDFRNYVQENMSEVEDGNFETELLDLYYQYMERGE